MNLNGFEIEDIAKKTATLSQVEKDKYSIKEKKKIA